MAENNNINFDFNCQYIPSCKNDFNFPDMGCNGFSAISMYSGESLSFGIIDSNEINCYYGEVLSTSLEIDELPFLFDGYDGSYFNTKIEYIPGFTQNFYDGSYGFLNDITVNKPIAMGIINSYNGDYLINSVSVNRIFQYELSSGDDLKIDLFTASIPDLKIDCYNGSECNLSISASALFNNIHNEHGENLDIDLKTYEVSGMEPKFYSGEYVEIDQLSVELNLPTNVYNGDQVNLNLNFNYQSLDINAYSGTYLNKFDLSKQEHPYFQSRIEVGSNVNFDIRFNSIALKPLIYSGENLSSDLVIKTDVEFPLINAYSGSRLENFEAYYTFRTLVPEVIEHVGSYSFIEMILDKTDWFTGAQGDTSDFDLMTFSSLKTDIYSGEDFVQNIEQTPPIEFRLICYSGEELNSDLRHLYSPNLTPLRITYNQWCDFNIDKQTTHFDLCSCCGYPIYHWIFEFRLNANDDPRTRCSDELGTSTHFDLLLNRRFEFNCYSGELVNYSQDEFINFKYISPFQDGCEILPFELGGDKNIILEPGNTIPDGGDANVELNPPEFMSLEKTSFRSGEYGLFNLHIRPVTKAYIPVDSARVDFYLSTDDSRFMINCYHGDMLQTNLRTSVQLQGWKAYDGAYLSTFKLDFPPEYMYSGEEVLVDLKNHYDVEFLEEGCVDNEYLVIDQEGKIDYDKSTKACIEFLPFEHALKARCY